MCSYGGNIALAESFVTQINGSQERKPPAQPRGGQGGPILPSEELGHGELEANREQYEAQQELLGLWRFIEGKKMSRHS